MSITTDTPVAKSDATVTEDHSILCRSIETGLSGIQMVVNSLKNGTPEVRDLLINECDVILECRVCRSLHRSLVNFIAHKRCYCQQHCCESLPLFNDITIENEEVVVIQPATPPESKEIVLHELENEITKPVAEEVKSEDAKVPNIKPEEKSLLKVRDENKMNAKTPPIYRHKQRVSPRWQQNSPLSSKQLSNGNGSLPTKFYNKCIAHLENRKTFQMETRIEVTPIASNSNAMYQKVNDTALTVASSFRKSFKSSDKRALCSKCGKSFTSLRKMVIHVQNVHTTQRTYFPCLYCKTNFAQIWSCLRHIMRAHNKSKTQVDKLREKVKSRAFQKSVDGGKDNKEKPTPSPVKVSVQEEKIPMKEEKVPIVQLKNAIIHQCNICSKIFSQKPSLDGHRSSCLAKQRARENAKRLAEEEAEVDLSGTVSNERPRRIVKRKKLDNDFVNSTYLNIRTNSVNPPKQTEHNKAAVTITSIPQNILQKLHAIIDINKKQCLQCKQSFVTLSNARRHAAGHIGYNRFACKKCEFQAYGRSQIRCHILKVHITGRVKVKESDLDRIILSLEHQGEENSNCENEQPKIQIKTEKSEVNEEEPVLKKDQSQPNNKLDESGTINSNVTIKTEAEEPTSSLEDSKDALTDNGSESSVVALMNESNESNGSNDDKKSLLSIINRLISTKDKSVSKRDESQDVLSNGDQNASSYAPVDHDYYASPSPDKCLVGQETELLEAVESIID